VVRAPSTTGTSPRPSEDACSGYAAQADYIFQAFVPSGYKASNIYLTYLSTEDGYDFCLVRNAAIVPEYNVRVVLYSARKNLYRGLSFQYTSPTTPRLRLGFALVGCCGAV
jgi:hypothetical protein